MASNENWLRKGRAASPGEVRRRPPKTSPRERRTGSPTLQAGELRPEPLDDRVVAREVGLLALRRQGPVRLDHLPPLPVEEEFPLQVGDLGGARIGVLLLHHQGAPYPRGGIVATGSLVSGLPQHAQPQRQLTVPYPDHTLAPIVLNGQGESSFDNPLPTEPE